MKIVKITLITFLAILSFSTISYASIREGMLSVKSSDKEQIWIYQNADETCIKDQWKQVWDCWYYFGEDGRSKQNTWFEIDGKWYYFNEWSIMLQDTTTPDGYRVGSDGACITETQTTSPWIGTYKADDDQIITVKSVDDKGIQVSFYGYSEEGWNTREYALQFADAEKKKAICVYSEHYKEIYVLTDTGIEITIEPAGGWAQGTYVKQK